MGLARPLKPLDHIDGQGLGSRGLRISWLKSILCSMNMHLQKAGHRIYMPL